MNDDTINLFCKLTEFLGQVLGKNYEIVFHVISKEGSYIKAIANNHISGRTLNSPLTEFASKLVQEKMYLKKDFLYNYKAMTKDNKSLKGSTFFITKKKKLVGILCINHDTSEFEKAIQKIIELNDVNNFEDIFNKVQKNSQDTINTENLSLNIEDMLTQSIDLSYIKSGFLLSSTQKMAMVKKLYDKGIFNIKGSITEVAKCLNISEPSVYRYLQKLKK